MTQEELNNLKIGEKAVDIQEYYWGPNGKILAYKVTIYTCVKYLLFFKKIKEYTFPFYFVSKEFALEFLKVYENYDFIPEHYNGFLLFNKNIQNQKFYYKMISAYHKLTTAETNHDALLENGIWNGLVCPIEHYGILYHSKSKCFSYSYIEEKEQIAAKEGTTGKTYSFKMIEEK